MNHRRNRACRRAATAGVAALAAVVLAVGCGGDDEGSPIPENSARFLLGQLEEFDRRSDPLRCDDIRQGTLPRIEERVAAINDRVDADVRDALEDGVTRLRDLLDEECDRQQEERRREREREEDTETDTTETPTPTTPIVPDTDTDTQEEPPPDDTGAEPPPDEEPPGNGGQPGEGNDGGQPGNDGGAGE